MNLVEINDTLRGVGAVSFILLIPISLWVYRWQKANDRKTDTAHKTLAIVYLLKRLLPGLRSQIYFENQYRDYTDQEVKELSWVAKGKMNSAVAYYRNVERFNEQVRLPLINIIPEFMSVFGRGSEKPLEAILVAVSIVNQSRSELFHEDEPRLTQADIDLFNRQRRHFMLLGCGGKGDPVEPFISDCVAAIEQVCIGYTSPAKVNYLGRFDDIDFGDPPLE